MRPRYTPRRFTPAEAARHAAAGDLVPWTEFAALTSTPPGTVRTWMDTGRLATFTGPDATGRVVRYVSLSEAATVELVSRTTRRRGPKRA